MTRLALALGLAVLLPSGAAAQDTVVVAPRYTPADERAVARFNAANTTRLFGEQTISRGMTIRTDVGAVNGPLSVYGVIDGDLVAINADVSIYAGAEVLGDVLVVGGRLVASADARVLGTMERHQERIGVRVRDGTLELTGEPIRSVVVSRDRRLRRSSNQGQATVVLSTGRSYNRIEGLPLHVGPRLTWTDPGGDTRFRLEALAVLRSAAGFGLDYDTRELGYDATGALRIGSRAQLELGGRAYDLVTPVEDWQLSDDEVGFATLLWHRDYRDYYLNRGVAGFARFSPTSGLTLFGEVAREEATSVAARDPWTPFRNAEPWRPNPVIDAGTFDVLRAGFELDNRTSRGVWGTGLMLRAEWERGESDDVSPVTLPVLIRPALPVSAYRYERVWADVRIRQPVGWGGLQVRAVGGGVIGDGVLPVQRRLSLGGPDPMPGYSFRRFACNGVVSDPAQPALCDRMLLFQAEYRGGIGFHPFDGGDWWDWESRTHDRRSRREAAPDWDDIWWDGPQFVLFADAGNAWLARAGFPDRLEVDVGVGLEVGNVGVYAARALERDQPIRFILRLQRRF